MIPTPSLSSAAAVHAWLVARPQRPIELLQELVRLPTVNPPGEHYAPCTALLAERLAATGLEVRRLPVPAREQARLLPGVDPAVYPRFNVIGHRPAPRGRPTLHLNAHYDVVPASEGWRFGPFTPQVDGPYIYGRGTADMKGAIAAVLFALEALSATGTAPVCGVEVSFTADEETDSACGADWVARHARLRADAVVVGEAGSGPAICCGHNGCLWFEVTVLGKSAHGSNPARGLNALEQMARLLRELDAYRRLIAKRTFRAPDGRVMRPTVNFGGVFGGGPGQKINTVPGRAHFSVDRRVLPNEDIAAAEREFREFVAAVARRVPRLRVRVDKTTQSESLFTPPDNALFAALAGSIRRVRRSRPKPYVSAGFNDMHFFHHHLGVPVVGYGPLGSRFHAIDERMPVRDLVTTARVYADLMLSFGAPGAP
jgi:succinyl-diaminopimelate desuccinylase